MAITKTKFINYVRCPRYVALDGLKKDKLDSPVSLEEYRKEEEESYIQELLTSMYDEEDNDLIDTSNPHLDVMLPYYNEVEQLAGTLAPKYFKGTFKYALKTEKQESFDAKINGIRYICYTDIYNEVDDIFNIIEVKATTMKKYLSIGKSYKDDFGNKKTHSIFKKDKDGIYYLLEDLKENIEDYMPEKKYHEYKEKLYNKLDPAGHYVYDLAVQRYIIENDLKQTGRKHQIPQVKYYLAVLNSEYEFEGTYENDLPVYGPDAKGEDIVSFIDMTRITKDFMDLIDMDRKKVEKYVHDLLIDPVPIGDDCENKRTTKCKYTDICWNIVPPKNSILNFIDNHHGFKDEMGNLYNRYDLINSGIVHMTDIPDNYLNREKNVIQKKVVETKKPYINLNKIKDGIKQITYPIYHLDFETFPCPIPRFKGEHPYSQSVFQFSLHIEKEEGICNKETDHFEYLATNHKDHRVDLIKKMIELIDINSGGTILVYNESFEKTRLKELANIFPIYKKELMKMREMIFDLMYIIKTKTELYKELGYEEEEAKMFNYYHPDMSGSFSIKKILPLFSNLTYKEMEIANGVEAIVAYANFPRMQEKEYKYTYQKLVEYCKQDTWAMVEILWGLKKECQIMSNNEELLAHN